ncbi:MAG: TraB/GumN family protein [Chitinophagaceae bacterium]
MKKFILTGCSLWLMAMAVAQKNIAENTLLWKISGNGLQKSSYLFGTMHLLCADDAKLSDNLKNVIKESEQIYFEVDMDDLLGMMGAMKYLKMNGNKKLQDILTAEEYKKIKDYFEKKPAMIPLEMMQYFKPYFISSLLSEQSMACTAQGGMEQSIMEESKQYKKEIKGLETVEFQASVFDSIPYELQAKELVKYIDSADKNDDATKELVAVYKMQDLKKIQELTEKEDGGVAEFIDLLLYNRNADWVNKISNIMPINGVLFAVGAAHLPGDKGVINLLRKKGFTVQPIANSLGTSM